MTWDPVHDTRHTFLACLWAQCAPGEPYGPLTLPSLSPDPDLDAAAAVLLTLLDEDLVLAVEGDRTTTHLGATVVRMTGAGMGPVATADVVLVSGDPTAVLGLARRGTPLAPETGATVVVVGRSGATSVELRGPGVPDVRTVTLPVPPSAVEAFTVSTADHPCGVDLLLVHDRHVRALPRSARVTVLDAGTPAGPGRVAAGGTHPAPAGAA